MAKIESVLKKPVRTEEKHPKRTIQWIHYSKLIRSAYQFYGEDDEEVIALADLIHADEGVLQNLLVRKSDADEYEIIAGHKRTLACKYNVENRGLKEYEFLPCIVVSVSNVRARWQVMSTNRHHDKTQYEIMKEIEDMKYIMENYPGEFPDSELRGRMVDRLAKALNMSRSVVSDYQNISHNLIEEGKEAFKEQKIDKSAAVALASLKPEEQKSLLDAGNVTHTSVKEYKKSLPESSLSSIRKVKEDTFKDWREFFAKENYKKWTVWTSNRLTEETFYLYTLSDKKSIIVKNYPTESGIGGEGEIYYLLEQGKHLEDCRIARHELESIYIQEVIYEKNRKK